MAKVTIVQAYEACENDDKGLIASYTKRYPLAMITLALIVNSGDEHTKEFLFGIPSTMSMNRIEKVMETGIKIEDISDDEDDTTEAEDTPVKPQKADTEDKPKKRRGRPKKVETPVEEPVEDAEEDEEVEAIPEEDTEIMNAPVDDEDEEADNDAEELEGYAAMNAVELFKLCKQRGMKVAPKQKAAAYIELLELDDAAKANADDPDDDEDDWDI